MKAIAFTLLAALLLTSTMIVGCGEPVSPNGGTRLVVDSLQVIALDQSTVRLIWLPPYHDSFNPTAYSYRVRWKPVDGVVSEPGDTGTAYVGSVEFAENSYAVDIGELQARMYEFTVNVQYAESKQVKTYPEPVEREGAPAERYATDFTLNEPIRMYEPASTEGSGLMLTEVVASPTRVAPADAGPGSLIVTMRVEGSPPNEVVRITPASLIPEHVNSGMSHPDLHLMTLHFGTGATPYHRTLPSSRPLDAWGIGAEDYLELTQWPGDLSIPTKDPAYGPEHPYNFILQLGEIDGPLSARRYMRVSILPEPDGTILRGAAPDRYIELEISVGFAGVPFA